MELDRNGLEVLDRAEALRLLPWATIGRVGIHSGALPVVLPVNFVLDGDQVVIRAGEGTKLDAATRNAVVAFEADEVDPAYHTGWSVVVTGRAREVTDPAEIERLETLPLPHWAGVNGHYITISTDIVSGRRLSHLHPPPSMTS
jgi:nitroimidazol reductase NimA-like FMN-containing flavoprotein (pyridoxamine 5'-phosphate oxidase superfamily)